jgi:lipopolysaccharide/colanic/teichoic acid biosynthesis glycosyltransferase
LLKRLFDLSAATAGLIAAFPLMLFISIWIRIDSKGPVFYRPDRGGRFGRPFKIFKFRSMVVDADMLGGPTTSGNDLRVTPSGRFIRKCKLDEISQLINVFCGKMSLVGPRPEVVWKVEKYSQEERKTLKLRPGITDWASIWNADEGSVLADAQDPDAVYEEVIRPIKMKLQLYYYETRNFFEDIKIIFYTFYRLINKSWTPKALTAYPTFDELRVQALGVIERQKEALKSTAV